MNNFEAFGHPPDESPQETYADAALIIRGIIENLKADAETETNLGLISSKFFAIAKLTSAANVLEELAK